MNFNSGRLMEGQTMKFPRCEIPAFCCCSWTRLNDLCGLQKMKLEMLSLSTKSTKDHVWKFKPVPSSNEDSENGSSSKETTSSIPSAEEVRQCRMSAAFAAASGRLLAPSASSSTRHPQ